MPFVRAAAAAEVPDPGRGKFARARGELVRRAVVLGAPVHDAGQPGVGLGQQRDLRPGAQPLYLREYVARTYRAVQAEGVRAHALHHDQRRRGVRARERASVLVAGEGHDGGLAADAAHGQQRRAGFGQGHHRLDYEQVDARLLQRGGLLGVDVEKLFKARRAERGEEQPRGGDVPGHERAAAGGLLRYRRQAEVELAHAVEYASRLELDAVRAEGGRVDHPAAGVNVAPLYVQHRLGVLQHPGLGAAAAGEAALLQLGARRAVEYGREV